MGEWYPFGEIFQGKEDLHLRSPWRARPEQPALKKWIPCNPRASTGEREAD